MLQLLKSCTSLGLQRLQKQRKSFLGYRSRVATCLSRTQNLTTIKKTRLQIKQNCKKIIIYIKLFFRKIFYNNMKTLFYTLWRTFQTLNAKRKNTSGLDVKAVMEAHIAISLSQGNEITAFLLVLMSKKVFRKSSRTQKVQLWIC